MVTSTRDGLPPWLPTKARPRPCAQDNARVERNDCARYSGPQGLDPLQAQPSIDGEPR